jgi:NAD(P)-dependent dehydrogenase (short-subunit alcohol dehydrogenase family)
MPKPIAEQVVVITGASSGIGRATALRFAARGATVVCAARGARALDSLVEQINAAGGTAVGVPTDVADPAAVRALADAAEERFGRIDTWVNNAAVGVWGRVEEITAAEFEQVLRVNFLGQVHGIHAALPALRRAGGGVLIGVVSVEGARAVPLNGPYTASKFAVRACYDTLRIELAQEGAPIAVTTILPASIDTPFFEHARSKLGVMVKPPPPVYAPELVADTIVYAARHPRREIPVGGAALGLLLGQRLSPALADAVLAVRRLGVGSQRTGRPDSGMDNVDSPLDEPGRVHGAHPGRVLRRSALTTVLGRRRRPGELALGALRRRHHTGTTGERADAAPTATGSGRSAPTASRATAAVRAGWGGALLMMPGMLLRAGGLSPVSTAAVTAARVLGARHLLQAALTAVRPTASVAVLGAAVDAAHAGTDVLLAVASARWRRTALTDAAVAAGFAAAGWRAWRHRADRDHHDGPAHHTHPDHRPERDHHDSPDQHTDPDHRPERDHHDGPDEHTDPDHRASRDDGTGRGRQPIWPPRAR